MISKDKRIETKLSANRGFSLALRYGVIFGISIYLFFILDVSVHHQLGIEMALYLVVGSTVAGLIWAIIMWAIYIRNR